MAKTRTDERILYEAVAQGLREIGLDAKYDCDYTANLRASHKIIINKNGIKYLLKIKMATGGTYYMGRIGPVTFGTHITGPDISDPKFFEKMAEIVNKEAKLEEE